MANTYTIDNLQTSSKDRARFTLGDVGALTLEDGSAAWLLSDEEITAFVAMYGYAEGVAQCADHLAIRFAMEPTQYKDEAGVDVNWSDRVKQWNAMAARLRAGAQRVQGMTAQTPLLQQTTGPNACIMDRFRQNPVYPREGF